MPHLLMIDDSIFVLKLAALYFQSRNYTYDQDISGQGGIEKALSNRYDLIILDMNLPDMSGLDIARELKARGSTTPVLLNTTENYLSEINMAEAVGVDYFCDKLMETIMDKVDEIFKNKQSELNLRN